MVVDLGWVDFDRRHSSVRPPGSSWAEGNLTESAGQLGKMVEHPNQSQLNIGPRPQQSPCKAVGKNVLDGLHIRALLLMGAGISARKLKG